MRFLTKLLVSFMVCVALMLLVSCVNNFGNRPTDIIIESPEKTTNDELEPPKSTIDGDQEQCEEPGFIALDDRLLPPINQEFDNEFENTFNELIDSVCQKELLALDNFLDENVIVNFGGKHGKSDFYEYWHLDQDPDQSPLWIELEKMIRLGGVYNEKEKSFLAPYVYSSFPSEFDVFEYFVVIDGEANVYEKANIESKVIDILNYNIIKHNTWDNEFWGKTDQDFVQIKTPSGAIGFLQKQFIRSPLDYRFSLVCNTFGKWKITFLIMGD